MQKPYADPKNPRICIENPKAQHPEYVRVPLYGAECHTCTKKYAVDDSLCEADHGEDGRASFRGWLVGTYYKRVACECGGCLEIKGQSRLIVGEKYLVREPGELYWRLVDDIPSPDYKNVTAKHTGRAA